MFKTINCVKICGSIKTIKVKKKKDKKEVT